MPRNQRERIMRGRIDPVTDIVALRRFAGLTQGEFAEALGISVHTLRNWEQGRIALRARHSLCCVSPRGTHVCCGENLSASA